ncbi:MAG: hypothetical protein QM612_00860 [Thermomonas sp.]|uniref:hypothetical protein n=1 Tax=Thermomonas sp. TaxID=1971895 RepID=UPI0039E4105B
MPASPTFPLLCLPLLLGLAGSLHAQESPREVVLPAENVRYDYAQVLTVRPIHQVLTTTNTERVCDEREGGKGSTLSRMAGAVKDKLTGDDTTAEERSNGLRNCRTEQVARRHQRVIAYDVDYIYRGNKFRTRMAEDPGNRLRIRISITPQPHD